jgi:heterodisulfide reductase subunit A
MSVSRARLLQPLYQTSYEVVQRALVVGGGLAGLTAALQCAQQGFSVSLIERSAELGGNALSLFYTEGGASPALHVQKLIQKVKNQPLIDVYKETEVLSIAGSCGNFKTSVSVRSQVQTISHGVVLIATGGEEYKPSEYLYGHHPGVVTQKEFEDLLINHPDEARKFKRVLMIQCVGSREPEHLYCSRVCCTAAVKNSLKLKSMNPEAQISVLYRDIRTYGLRESFYLKARQQGVRFFRFEREQKPQVVSQGDILKISVFDAQLQTLIELEADLLVLSAAIRPDKEIERLADIMRLPRDEDGFFMEAHLKLRPLDFATTGFYLCGLAQGPKFASEAITQAHGAVSRAVTVLSKNEITAESMINHVDSNLCRACGECEKACSFEAIKIEEGTQGRKLAVVTEALCTGCGVCNVACPTGAASLAHFQDEQVNVMIDESG